EPILQALLANCVLGEGLREVGTLRLVVLGDEIETSSDRIAMRSGVEDEYIAGVQLDGDVINNLVEVGRRRIGVERLGDLDIVVEIFGRGRYGGTKGFRIRDSEAQLRKRKDLADLGVQKARIVVIVDADCEHMQLGFDS